MVWTYLDLRCLGSQFLESIGVLISLFLGEQNYPVSQSLALCCWVDVEVPLPADSRGAGSAQSY